MVFWAVQQEVYGLEPSCVYTAGNEQVNCMLLCCHEPDETTTPFHGSLRTVALVNEDRRLDESWHKEKTINTNTHKNQK